MYLLVMFLLNPMLYAKHFLGQHEALQGGGARQMDVGKKCNYELELNVSR